VHDPGVGFRAQFRDINVFSAHARTGKLIDIRLPEIEVRPPPSARRKPPRYSRGIVTRLPERGHDLLANFAAAGAERRPDGGNQVRRPAPELALHRSHACRGHGLDCAPPTCMNRADSSISDVREQNRRTVRDANSNRNTWIVTEDHIRFRRGPGSVVTATRCDRRGAMHLTDQSEAVSPDAHCSCQALPIGRAIT
jgi:hypothetical protein